MPKSPYFLCSVFVVRWLIKDMSWMVFLWPLLWAGSSAADTWPEKWGFLTGPWKICSCSPCRWLPFQIVLFTIIRCCGFLCDHSYHAVQPKNLNLKIFCATMSAKVHVYIWNMIPDVFLSVNNMLKAKVLMPDWFKILIFYNFAGATWVCIGDCVDASSGRSSGCSRAGSSAFMCLSANQHSWVGRIGCL